MDTSSLIAQLYKSESGRLLAVLTRLFGTHNWQLAEDVLQFAFSQALDHWPRSKVPDNPQAWLMQTAKNRALDVIRTQNRLCEFGQGFESRLKSEWTLEHTLDAQFSQDNIKDDVLRMIFVCCHPSIAAENRLPFILKTLCGFSLHNISRALLLPQETVKKRLFRTRKQMRAVPFELPQPQDQVKAMDTVHKVLYLLFNEGYYSTCETQVIRLEFCQDAIALLTLVADEGHLANGDTYGLLAWMHFCMARVHTRTDEQGVAIPLNLQDRRQWQPAYINMGEHLLTIACGLEPGPSPRFVLEASIAQKHCAAKDFEHTDWPGIVYLYNKLDVVYPTPMTRLNLAIALGYCNELERAIEMVEALLEDPSVSLLHSVWAVLAHLQARAGNAQLAYSLAEKSRTLGGTHHEQQMMQQQLERLLKEQN